MGGRARSVVIVIQRGMAAVGLHWPFRCAPAAPSSHGFAKLSRLLLSIQPLAGISVDPKAHRNDIHTELAGCNLETGAHALAGMGTIGNPATFGSDTGSGAPKIIGDAVNRTELASALMKTWAVGEHVPCRTAGRSAQDAGGQGFFLAMRVAVAEMPSRGREHRARPPREEPNPVFVRQWFHPSRPERMRLGF